MTDFVWRQPPHLEQPERLQSKIRWARWHGFDPGVHVSADTDEDVHVFGVAMRCMDVRLIVSGRILVDGVIMPGTLSVTTPGAPASALFRGPYDALYLHVPNTLIADYAPPLQAQNRADLHAQVLARPDPVAEALGLALLSASQLGVCFGPLYADSIGIALVARIMASLQEGSGATRLRVTPMPKWRLKRVMDYVEANLSKPVGLADLAGATGLTRMHFAAQFRAATGLRPHEYLLRRRIERAQEMLAGSMMPVTDVAQDVGFQSQAHFTSVFKRFTGRPPQAWRHRNSRVA